MSKRDADKQEAIPQTGGIQEWMRTMASAVKYLLLRGLMVYVTIVIGIYAAIWVTNVGGLHDESRRNDIEYTARFALASSGFDVTSIESEGDPTVEMVIDAMIQAADLDRPFAVRSVGYLRDALTFQFGVTRRTHPITGSHRVIDIILHKLPLTLFLFGSANLIAFFGGLLIALSLSRKYGTFIDRVVTFLIPLFAAPAWFHGLFLVTVFAAFAKLLPWGGIIGAPYPETQFEFVMSFLRHMALPLTSCVLGTLPMSIYANRSLFLIHSRDDHVELAKAKGLPSRRLNWHYILRPVLPPIVTNFALTSLVAWESVVLTEMYFGLPGLGRLLIQSIQNYGVAIVIGALTLLAFLYGLTILLLDVIYVLVDPRVKLGTRGIS